METYLSKNPTAGKAACLCDARRQVSYARIGLKVQFQLKKIKVDRKNRFRYQVG
jgi:hypothetical protein